MPSSFQTRLERQKQGSVGQLLLRAARLFNERAVARLQAEADPRVRRVHTTLFPHIDLEGTRLTVLAERVGVSKQAVGQLVAELEELGIVRCEPDPADRRAKRVRFSRRGRNALLHGLDLLQSLEAELAGEVGRTRLERLRGDLARLVAALER